MHFPLQVYERGKRAGQGVSQGPPVGSLPKGLSTFVKWSLLLLFSVPLEGVTAGEEGLSIFSPLVFLPSCWHTVRNGYFFDTQRRDFMK